MFVNGRPVVLDGKITDERPGRALRGPGYKRAPSSVLSKNKFCISPAASPAYY